MNSRSRARIFQKGQRCTETSYFNRLSADVLLKQSEKLYDGLIRFYSEMLETHISNEIAHLLKTKKFTSHDFQPSDFDCVRCVNNRIKTIDGDTHFDANCLQLL